VFLHVARVSGSGIENELLKLEENQTLVFQDLGLVALSTQLLLVFEILCDFAASG